MALHVARALITHGKVKRGWFGVTIRDLTPELAKSVHVETLKGALVVDVVKGGPAEQGGLKKDDVVIALGGKEIPDSSSLRNDVANAPIGQEVEVTILRGGKKEEIKVKIGNLEASAKIMAAAVKDRLGAEMRSLSTEELEKYGLNENQGVAISWLDPKGPLHGAGFEVGDVILGINNQPVAGVDSFVQLVTSLTPNQKASFVALDHKSGNTGTVLVMVR
jgi:serine protease Do